MASKRKSAPQLPLRTSPRLHPQDEPLRPTRQRKARFTKTESQSTLTQINYVTTSSSSYGIQDTEDDEDGEDDEDDEWEERPRKRRRQITKFERDEHSSKRQSTLTQIDFTKLLTPIDLSESNDVENEEPYEADSRRPHLQSVKPKRNVATEEALNPRVRKPPSIPIGILKTPKKFRGMAIVPSSQSPPDSPLSIQRHAHSENSSIQVLISPIKFRLQRSPLRERPTNIAMVSQNKQRVGRKSGLSQPASVTMVVADSDEDENIEPAEAESCLSVGTETQAVLDAIDAACEEYNTRSGQKISSLKEPTLDADANGEELHTCPAMSTSAAAETQARNSSAIEFGEEPHTCPATPRNDASETQTPNSSAIEFAHVPLSDRDDTNSPQLRRETQACNEHLLSSRDPKPMRIPSSQDCEQEQEACHRATIMQPPSAHHTNRPSQATTTGTSPAATPHRTQRGHCSSPSKHSVVVVPSSPVSQRTSLAMPPPEHRSSPVLSRSAKTIRDLRNKLLEFDYEDDPVSVSQLLPESLVSGSVPMPPTFSSQTQNE